MRRRAALAGAALACAPWCLAQGQRPHRIGFLTHHDRTDGQVPLDTFLAHMRARGWEAGRDFVVEARYGGRTPEGIAAGAAELVQLKPALVVAPASSNVAALQQVTGTIPIVGIGMVSPVETGHVRSLARPGGNVTGTTFNQPEFAGKTVEVLKAAAPRIRRIAVILNLGFTGQHLYLPHAERAAQGLGVALQYVDVRRPSDLRLQEVERADCDAIYFVHDYATAPVMREVAAFAIDRRMPSVGSLRLFPAAGGLMSLDTDPAELFSAAADYTIRILQGANPALLPVQQPTRFHLILNRRTADAIQLPVSQQFLLRVNETIA